MNEILLISCRLFLQSADTVDEMNKIWSILQCNVLQLLCISYVGLSKLPKYRKRTVYHVSKDKLRWAVWPRRFHMGSFERAPSKFHKEENSYYMRVSNHNLELRKSELKGAGTGVVVPKQDSLFQLVAFIFSNVLMKVLKEMAASLAEIAFFLSRRSLISFSASKMMPKMPQSQAFCEAWPFLQKKYLYSLQAVFISTSQPRMMFSISVTILSRKSSSPFQTDIG